MIATPVVADAEFVRDIVHNIIDEHNLQNLSSDYNAMIAATLLGTIVYNVAPPEVREKYMDTIIEAARMFIAGMERINEGGAVQ